MTRLESNPEGTQWRVMIDGSDGIVDELIVSLYPEFRGLHAWSSHRTALTLQVNFEAAVSRQKARRDKVAQAGLAFFRGSSNSRRSY